MKLLITGVGSGLGKALALEGLRRGYEVYALSRHLPEELSGKVRFVRCDLSYLERVSTCLLKLIDGVSEIDLVILNAGILGKFGDMVEVPLKDFLKVMDVNVWSNKIILDTLLKEGIRLKQVVAISSGAAVNCNRGWNAYSISKASLNCLIKLYSREAESTHFTAVAPGLVFTPMLEEVMKQSEEKYPSVGRIKASPKRRPEEAARMIFDLLPRFLEFESGSFLDVRKL